MNEKELDKSLNKTVKPGTEQIALNTAQTQANQLLTEQTMNLQAERQVMTSNSERDVELRGAIELGAMNEAQLQPQPQVQLPPQAAGLRPETQQLLAKYGVNPNITESAKTMSNSSQTRTANSKMQVIPNNKQGGETRVTNTTNITNITNNNSRVETNVDMPKQPAVLPPSRSSRLTPVAVGAVAGMAAMASHNKFKTFLNNLFAKRDHERQLQEREFRRRDWSIQRMSRKVLERMNSISEKFANKMNPEKIGSTFTSQIKLFLSMAGLTLLPKVWPSIISGINKVGEVLTEVKNTFNSTEGGFFTKLTSAFISGTSTLAGNIVGALQGVGDVIGTTLAKIISGKDWDPQNPVTLADAIGNKIVDLFKGEGAHKFESFGEMIGTYFNNSWEKMKEFLQVAIDDRADAIKTVWNKDRDGWDLSPENILKTLIEVLGAAIGGHKALAGMKLSETQNKGKEKVAAGQLDMWGRIDSDKNGSASTVWGRTVYEANQTETTGATGIYEGLNLLSRAGQNKDFHGKTIEFNSKDIDRLVNKLKYSVEDKDEYINRVNSTISQAITDGIISVRKNRRSKDVYYTIDMKYMPQLVGVLTGNPIGYFLDPDKYSDYIDPILNDHLRKIQSSSSRSDLSVSLDEALRKNDPKMKSEFNEYQDAIETQKWWSDQYDIALKRAADATGFTDVKERFEDAAEKTEKKLEGPKGKYEAAKEGVRSTITKSSVVNEDGSLNWDKAGDVAMKGAKDTWDFLAGKAGEAKTTVGKVVDQALYGADTGNNPKYEYNNHATQGTKWRDSGSMNLPKDVVGDNKITEEFLNTPPTPEESGNLATNWTKDSWSKLSWEDKWSYKMHGMPYESYLSQSYNVDLLDNESTPIEKRREIIIRWLQNALGLNENQAIGVTAVMESESNLDPKIYNQWALNVAKAAYPDSGLCQWQGRDRVVNGFHKWYDSTYGDRNGRKDVAEFPAKVQLEYLAYELSHGRKNLLNRLRNASGFSEAADLFFRGYENGSASESGGSLATVDQINNAYANVGWAKSLQGTGVTPHMHMSKGRQQKALGIYQLLKGGEISEADKNYLASINLSKAKADTSGALSFTNLSTLSSNRSISSGNLSKGRFDIYNNIDYEALNSKEEGMAAIINSLGNLAGGFFEGVDFDSDLKFLSEEGNLIDEDGKRIKVTQTPSIEVESTKVENSSPVIDLKAQDAKVNPISFTPISPEQIANDVEANEDEQVKDETPIPSILDNSSVIDDHSTTVVNYNAIVDYANASFTEIKGRKLSL